MIYTNHHFGLTVTDTATSRAPGRLPSTAQRRAFLDGLILSVSGMRGVFAADGDEESRVPLLTDAARAFLLSVAAAFSERFTSRPPRLALAIDSRPTGPAMADTLIAALSCLGVHLHYLFISPAPEIMAYVQMKDPLDGFIYISASHNPVGHNGLKLGFGDGKVIGADQAAPLIARVRELYLADTGVLADLWREVGSAAADTWTSVYDAVNTTKHAAEEAYRQLADRVITGETADPDRCRQTLRRCLDGAGPAVLAELNGSARGTSIDAGYLASYGVRCRVENGRPGAIVHRIVPEGDALRPAADLLDSCGEEVLFAYVPDCDGDRGNIVARDRHGKAFTVQAQQLFALCVLSELAYMTAVERRTRPALVVNGPTSARVDRIAAAFGAHVFRAEVGEANVVELAHQKGGEGFAVRILGEGSNGGNIILPGTVRDPLQTVFSLLKLLYLIPDGNDRTLGQLALAQLGVDTPARPDLAECLSRLPRWSTTDAFETEAKYPIHTAPSRLKANYERLFPQWWREKQEDLACRFGITAYSLLNYEGTDTRPGPGNRTGDEKGGFKVAFHDDAGECRGFLWMRGSGTEPVFRVLADIAGDDNDQAELLAWHKEILTRSED